MELLALLLLPISLFAQRAESFLQSAMKKESVDGNLPAATSLRKILNNQAFGCANVSADGRLMACAVNYVDMATGQPLLQHLRHLARRQVDRRADIPGRRCLQATPSRS